MSDQDTTIKKISYSLFTPKKTYDHRFWDENRDDIQRYWFNIPAIYAINSFLFPEFKTFLYIDEQTTKHKLFPFLEEISKGNFTVVKEDYRGHEPSFWRMKPLWEKDVSFFMSKDIDSIVNEIEYKCYFEFIKSKELVSSIRSHENHYGYPCRMLMGLSSFKSSQISKEIKTESLEEFKKRYSVRDSWDNDQLTIINCFTNDLFFTSEFYLDFAVCDQVRGPGFFCKTIKEEELDYVKIEEDKKELFDYINKHNLCNWCGQPSDVRGKHLIAILNITQRKDIIDLLKEFNVYNFYL
jgi:hypothetical protein